MLKNRGLPPVLAMTTRPHPPLRGISSMATRQVLAELAAAWARAGGGTIEIESVGGVDAARRVAAGEPFDVVMLAADSIERLAAAGHAVAGSRRDLLRSPMAVAVRAGAPAPGIGTEAALRQAVSAARAVGYSTGPSGSHLTALFERWGIAETLRDSLVQARPGVPVASLLAGGEVELGFQQLSELLGVDGVAVLGTLPPGAEFITTFAGARCASSTQADAVRDWLDFATAPVHDEIKRHHGMAPA